MSGNSRSPKRHDRAELDGLAESRRRRAEVVDVLAEALWGLLCAGHGPGKNEVEPVTAEEHADGSTC